MSIDRRQLLVGGLLAPLGVSFWNNKEIPSLLTVPKNPLNDLIADCGSIDPDVANPAQKQLADAITSSLKVGLLHFCDDYNIDFKPTPPKYFEPQLDKIYRCVDTSCEIPLIQLREVRWDIITRTFTIFERRLFDGLKQKYIEEPFHTMYFCGAWRDTTLHRTRIAGFYSWVEIL